MLHRILAVASIAAAVPVGAATAGPVGEPDGTPLSCDGKRVGFHVDRAITLIDRAYSTRRYPDPTPAKRREIEAWQVHRRCVLDDTRRERISEHRDHARADYEREWHRLTYTPYPGGGQWWAIPYYIVICESHATNIAPHGYYQMLSWLAYGGGRFAPYASAASKEAQDLIAHRIWTEAGPSAWACA